MDIWQILSLALGILAMVLGVRWAQIKALLKQVSEALTAMSEALEDDEVSKDEARKLAKEWERYTDIELSEKEWRLIEFIRELEFGSLTLVVIRQPLKTVKL